MGWLVGIISTCLLFVISLIGSETLSNDLFAAIGTISIVLMVFSALSILNFEKEEKNKGQRKRRRTMPGGLLRTICRLGTAR